MAAVVPALGGGLRGEHARQLDCYTLLQHTHAALANGAVAGVVGANAPAPSTRAPPGRGGLAAAASAASAAPVQTRTLVLGGPVGPNDIAALASLHPTPASRAPRRRLSHRVRSLARRARDLARLRRARAGRVDADAVLTESNVVAPSSRPVSSSRRLRVMRILGDDKLYVHDEEHDDDLLVNPKAATNNPNERRRVGCCDWDDVGSDEDTCWGFNDKKEDDKSAWSAAGNSIRFTTRNEMGDVSRDCTSDAGLLFGEEDLGPRMKYEVDEPRSLVFPVQFGEWASADSPNSIAFLPKVGRFAETKARHISLPRSAGIAPVRRPRLPDQSTSSLTAASDRSGTSEAGTARSSAPTSPSHARKAPLSPTSDITNSKDGDRDEEAWLMERTRNMGAKTFHAFVGDGNVAEKIASAVVEISSEDEDSQILQGMLNFSERKRSPRLSAVSNEPIPSSARSGESSPTSSPSPDNEYEVDGRVQEIELNNTEIAVCSPGIADGSSVPAAVAFRRRATKSTPCQRAENDGVRYPPAVIMENDAASSSSSELFENTTALRSGRVLSDFPGMPMAEDDFISFLFDDHSALGTRSGRLFPGKAHPQAGELEEAPMDTLPSRAGVDNGGAMGGTHRSAWGLSRPTRAGTDPRRQGGGRRSAERAVPEKDKEEPRFSAPMRRALARVKLLSYLA